jgi:hypothetical protein
MVLRWVKDREGDGDEGTEQTGKRRYARIHTNWWRGKEKEKTIQGNCG